MKSQIDILREARDAKLIESVEEARKAMLEKRTAFEANPTPTNYRILGDHIGYFKRDLLNVSDVALRIENHDLYEQNRKFWANSFDTIDFS